MTEARVSFRDHGFTLIEVLVALLLTAIAVVGLAGLFVTAAASVRGARTQTSSSTLAEQRMEELRALTWTYDAARGGVPSTDMTTDLSVSPPSALGRGLSPSPQDALDVNTAGYVDFLDGAGRWVGTGASPPAAAVFVRRWIIRPLPLHPTATVILEVLVTTVRRERSLLSPVHPRPRYEDDALLVSAKTRKVS